MTKAEGPHILLFLSFSDPRYLLFNIPQLISKIALLIFRAKASNAIYEMNGVIISNKEFAN